MTAEAYLHVSTTDVRFAETDAQGVVFFGEYITYFDEAIFAYLRAIDYPYEDILEAGWELFVVHVDMDYHQSATFGDSVRNMVRVNRIGTSSVEFGYEAYRDKDDTILASGTLVQAATKDGDSHRIPEEFRERVRTVQSEPPVEN